MRFSLHMYSDRVTMLEKDLVSATARINEAVTERNALSQKLVYWLDSEQAEQRRYSSSMRNLEVSSEILQSLRTMNVSAKASP